MSSESKKRARETEDEDDDGGLDPKVAKVSLFTTDWGSEYLTTLDEKYTVEELKDVLEPELIPTIQQAERATNLRGLFDALHGLPEPSRESTHWINKVGSSLLDTLARAWQSTFLGNTHCEGPTMAQVGLLKTTSPMLRHVWDVTQFGTYILRSGNLQAYQFAKDRGLDVTLQPDLFKRAALETTTPSLALLDQVIPLWVHGSYGLYLKDLSHVKCREVLDHLLDHAMEWFGDTNENLLDWIETHVIDSPNTVSIVLVEKLQAKDERLCDLCGNADFVMESFTLLERLVNEAKADITKEGTHWALYAMEDQQWEDDVPAQSLTQLMHRLEWLGTHGVALSALIITPWCREIYHFFKAHKAGAALMAPSMIHHALHGLDLAWLAELQADGFRCSDFYEFLTLVHHKTPKELPARVQCRIVKHLGVMGAKLTLLELRNYRRVKTHAKPSVVTVLKRYLVQP